jgi:hypothetical protein
LAFDKAGHVKGGFFLLVTDASV